RNGVPLAVAPTATLAFDYFKPDGTSPATATELWSVQVDLTVANGQESQAFRVRAHPRSFR
ncbi:MAG: hypothetical protein ABIO65_12325, partial [Nitrospiria bacterium]